MNNKKLKILFAIRTETYFHYYKSIVEALLSRGHRVLAVFDRYAWSEGVLYKESLEQVENLKRNFSNFDYCSSRNRKDIWRRIIWPAREILNYRRYLVVEGQSDYFRRRWIAYLPQIMQTLLTCRYTSGLFNRLIRTQFAGKTLKLIERGTPPSPQAVKKIREFAPDVVFAGPANYRRSSVDVEYLKAARFLGIPTAVGVLSWDNLTTKGVFHTTPDILMVWNSEHAEEAQQHHGVPLNHIKIVGSTFFDTWFTDLKPSSTRAEFCQKCGLKPEYPIVLYLGSSTHMAEDESWIVRSLRKTLDNSSDERLVNTQILIRPHPANAEIYKGVENEKVAVFPKQSSWPNSSENLQTFYDSVYHSIASIGVNTSATIDAIILGRPAIIAVADKYSETQMEAQYFKTLLKWDVVELARTSADFEKIIKNLLDGRDEYKEKRNIFVKNFIRPLGLEKSAGEAAVHEIENLATNFKSLKII